MRRLACPSNDAHAKHWTNVQLEKPRLTTFTSKIQFKGFAYKRGPTPRRFFNWQHTFFLLQHPFLSYFASNDPKTECLGIIYVEGATIERVPHYPGESNVVKLSPITRRNLRHESENDDENNYYLKFETSAEADKWVEHLQNPSLGMRGPTAALAASPTMSPTRSPLRSPAPEMEDGLTAATPFGFDDSASPKEVATKIQATSTLLQLDCRRKSFFNAHETQKHRNSDFVHPVRCVLCKMSPVYGYLYTCVACENWTVCSSCFREDDHNFKHQFLIAPDVDGEAPRIFPCLEGTAKPFRTVELIAFEALFRLLSGALDGTTTRSIPKRTLLQNWHAARENFGLDLPNLSESHLTDCRNVATITFEDFMNVVVRRALMRGKSDFSSCCKAFELTLNIVQTATQGQSVTSWDPSFPSALEEAVLQLFLVTCSQNSAKISVEVALQLFSRIHGTLMDDATEATIDEVSALFVLDGLLDAEEISVDLVFAKVTQIAIPRFRQMELPAHHHGVMEAIENALLYVRQEGLGMYSSQSETFHPLACNICSTMPIIGYAFHCQDCEDFDLCARCFHQRGSEHIADRDRAGHHFIRLPGGASVTVSAAAPKETTSRSKRKGVQFYDDQPL